MRSAFLPMSDLPTRDIERMSRREPAPSAATRMTMSSLKPNHAVVSVASMLAFNWFFLAPVHTLTLSDSRNWLALLVYLAIAVVVGELAARSRRRAQEAAVNAAAATALREVYEHLHKDGAVADLKDRIITAHEMDKLVAGESYKKWIKDYLR